MLPPKIEEEIRELEIWFTPIGQPSAEPRFRGLREAVESDLAALRAEVARLRKALGLAAQSLRHVRVLDCGAHYCRYCLAKSPAWEHSPSCPYVESQAEYTAARALMREIEALAPHQEGTP